MERRNNFDALRLLAAITVIFSHSFLIAQGVEKNDPLNLLTGNQCMIGLAAVFVFFAVSGFLITDRMLKMFKTDTKPGAGGGHP